MYPHAFLKIGGLILVLMGVLGFFGAIGPTPEQSVFGNIWWFDNAENWAHLIVGIIAIIAAYAISANGQKTLTLVIGIVAVLLGLYSILGYTSFLGANLENPLDSILYILIGAWALVAWKRGDQRSGLPVQSPPM